MKAVIQAGGKGTRLHPYTFVLPKPLMPVGEDTVIQVLLKWLRRWDIQEVCVTTGHMGDLIRIHCGDGSQYELDIVYSQEPEPLGTIGPLHLHKDQLTDTFLVLNGDLITDLDLRSFIRCHKEAGAMVTVAVTEQKVETNLGVIDAPNGRIVDFREKPQLEFLVSMGIYCMEPSVFELIPRGIPFGFDDLMNVALTREEPVHVYRHQGLWMDLGREKDLYQAQQKFVREYKDKVLGA